VTTPLQALDRLVVRQRYTPLVNRDEIREVADDGSLGDLVALAQQKRLAFKEQVTFFADEARTVPVFGFKARQRLDIAAMHDVTDDQGRPIGWFRKDFAASLLRSTWHLGHDGLGDLVGRERNVPIAIVRRVWGVIPFVRDVGRPQARPARPVHRRHQRARPGPPGRRGHGGRPRRPPGPLSAPGPTTSPAAWPSAAACPT
jgi:hypothetical protein